VTLRSCVMEYFH